MMCDFSLANDRPSSSMIIKTSSLAPKGTRQLSAVVMCSKCTVVAVKRMSLVRDMGDEGLLVGVLLSPLCYVVVSRLIS